jgi:hypothetical protein
MILGQAWNFLELQTDLKVERVVLNASATSDFISTCDSLRSAFGDFLASSSEKPIHLSDSYKSPRSLNRAIVSRIIR